jgi:hypothetical protein
MAIRQSVSQLVINFLILLTIFLFTHSVSQSFSQSVSEPVKCNNIPVNRVNYIFDIKMKSQCNLIIWLVSWLYSHSAASYLVT